MIIQLDPSTRYLHKSYPYTNIVFGLDGIYEHAPAVKYIVDNYGYLLHNRFFGGLISRLEDVYSDKKIYIRLLKSHHGDTIEISWDSFTNLDRFLDREYYEKVFGLKDLYNGVVTSILYHPLKKTN